MWKELIGKQFGRWTVIGNYIPGSRQPWKHGKILCKCLCGTERYVDIYSLLNGKSKACKQCHARKVLRNPTDPKECAKCHKVKPITEFNLLKSSWDGRGYVCKECNHIHNTSNEQKRRAREWSKKYQKRRRKKRSIRKYGLSEENYQSLINKKICAICGSDKRLVIDHNHKTKKVRDLICSRCNVILGFAREDISILKNIIIYLEKHKET